jgi:hypothetical protein
VLRGIAEGLVIMMHREWRAQKALARGDLFPVVVFDAGQRTKGFDTGRLGAELIVEAEGIPRKLWRNHFVS